MATIDLKLVGDDKLAELAHIVLFVKKLRLAITYMTEDKEVTATYQFITMEREDEVMNRSKNTPRSARSSPPTDVGAPEPKAISTLVFCDNYTCNKEDPFKIFGRTFESVSDFYDFARLRKRKERDGFNYDLTAIAVYPYVWYECFEKIPAVRIAAIKKLIPSILAETKTLTLPKKPQPPTISSMLASLAPSRNRLTDKKKVTQLQKRLSDTRPGPSSGGATSFSHSDSDSDSW